MRSSKSAIFIIGLTACFCCTALAAPTTPKSNRGTSVKSPAPISPSHHQTKYLSHNETTANIKPITQIAAASPTKTLEELYVQIKQLTVTLKTCSQLEVVQKDNMIVVTGVTNALKQFKNDLPDSDKIDIDGVVNLPSELCDFLNNFQELNAPKMAKTPYLAGPGRQSVTSAKDRKSIKMDFNFDPNAQFARIYYIEWAPEPSIQEVVDLKSDASRKQTFGSTDLPQDRTGEMFALEHEDYGALKINGYGTRLFVLVQSSTPLYIDTSHPEYWFDSIICAQLEDVQIEIASTWLELYKK